MARKTSFMPSLLIASIVAVSSVMLLGTGSDAMAKTVYDRSGLATCVPDADDPCADIVAPGASIKVSPGATSGRMTVEQSPSSSETSVSGALPLPDTAPDIRINKAQGRSNAANLVNTKIIERNNTPYSLYWRLLAVRNSQGWFWPSGSTYYSSKKYSSVTKVIRCVKGEALYFGATSTDGRYYWGYGADFNQKCTSGCYGTCTGGTLTINLSY